MEEFWSGLAQWYVLFVAVCLYLALEAWLKRKLPRRVYFPKWFPRWLHRRFRQQR